jgi:hypothetical protein
MWSSTHKEKKIASMEVEVEDGLTKSKQQDPNERASKHEMLNE